MNSFARAVGITSSAAAELWALRHGLSLCIQLQLQEGEVELDAESNLLMLKFPHLLMIAGNC